MRGMSKRKSTNVWGAIEWTWHHTKMTKHTGLLWVFIRHACNKITVWQMCWVFREPEWVCAVPVTVVLWKATKGSRRGACKTPLKRRTVNFLAWPLYFVLWIESIGSIVRLSLINTLMFEQLHSLNLCLPSWSRCQSARAVAFQRQYHSPPLVCILGLVVLETGLFARLVRTPEGVFLAF